MKRVVHKEPSIKQQEKKERAVWKWKPGFLWSSFLLSFTTATQTNHDLISHDFISSIQFVFHHLIFGPINFFSLFASSVSLGWIKK